MGDLIQATFERLRPAIGRLSQRKVLLAYTAFARRFESLFPPARLEELLRTAEQVADGEQDLRTLSAVQSECFGLVQNNREMESRRRTAAYIACELGFYARRRSWELSGRPPRSKSAAESLFHTTLYWLKLLPWELPSLPEQDWFGEQISALLNIIRDVEGDSTAHINAEWLTDDVVRIARSISDDRDFAAMPILADVLQDAGCDSAAVLDHCRGSGPHVRGCWVVDLLLGKE